MYVLGCTDGRVCKEPRLYVGGLCSGLHVVRTISLILLIAGELDKIGARQPTELTCSGTSIDHILPIGITIA